jgi:hypothetical protein
VYLVWVCCPDVSETRRHPTAKVCPKRREKIPTPGGDVPQDIIDTAKNIYRVSICDIYPRESVIFITSYKRINEGLKLPEGLHHTVSSLLHRSVMKFTNLALLAIAHV